MDDSTFFLSRTQVRELDRRAIHDYGIPGVVLMENAGRGAAELLMRLNPDKLPVVLLCGPGNNGGDGFVIARHLDNHGWPFKAYFVTRSIPTEGDAFINYRVCLRSGLLYGNEDCGIADPPSDLLDEWITLRKAWVVDALFGTGLSRPLSAPYDRVVAAVNASGNPVLAVDIPSGLDCDTGEPLGPTVRATHTATFVASKKGFANPSSSVWTGEVHVIDIGAPRKLVDEYRC